MKKRILSALLALCMVFALGTVGAMADTPTADPPAGEAPAVEDKPIVLVKEDNTEVGYDHLAGAIKAAADGDTIQIKENVDVNNVSTSAASEYGVYIITENITIEGIGSNITLSYSGSANNESGWPATRAVFTVQNGAQVTIKNITINNNADQSSRGARNGIQAFGANTKVALENVANTIKNK